MTQRFAVKRLSAVEIDAIASNQHELNAGKLRSELDFPEGRSEGDLRVLVYKDDTNPPTLIEGTYTLYDARERVPSRSEYRLYYSSPELAVHGQPGDILALYREQGQTDLQGIIARPGSKVERELSSALGGDTGAAFDTLSFVSPAPESKSRARGLLQTLIPLEWDRALWEATRRHSLYREAVEESFVPSTKEMAKAGREIMVSVWGTDLGIDDFIYRALEAETELYFAIEREVRLVRLRDVLNDSEEVDLDSLLSMVLSIQQSRKSRRGYSLQHHLAALLDRERIPYTPQCETEGGRTPDFIVPSHDAYHDTDYPDHRLKLVGCKTKVRERWGQILEEGDRVRNKYLLTVDDDLPVSRLVAMQSKNLSVFMPRELIVKHYNAETAQLIREVGEMIRELKLVL